MFHCEDQRARWHRSLHAYYDKLCSYSIEWRVASLNWTTYWFGIGGSYFSIFPYKQWNYVRKRLLLSAQVCSQQWKNRRWITALKMWDLSSSLMYFFLSFIISFLSQMVNVMYEVFMFFASCPSGLGELSEREKEVSLTWMFILCFFFHFKKGIKPRNCVLELIVLNEKSVEDRIVM